MPVSPTTGSTLAQRLDTRLALRSMFSKQAAADQANIEALLANFQMVDSLAATCSAEHQAEAAAASGVNTATPTDKAGPILTFFQWLISNESSVISFIQSIIALFTPAT